MGAIRFRDAACGRGHFRSHFSFPELWLGLDPGQAVSVSGIDFVHTSVVEIAAPAGTTMGRNGQLWGEVLACFFVEEGEVMFDDGAGNQAAGGPDSFWTFSDAGAFEMTWCTSGRIVAALVPGQVVRDFGLAPLSGFVSFGSDSTLRRPASAFLISLGAGIGPVSSVAAYFMEKLVHEMIGGLLLENHGAGRAGHRQSLYHQAMALIFASCGDPALTPKALSQELNVSLRHLQREFQKRGESLADSIRQSRIDLAVRLLTDDSLSVLSLEQIAGHAGFGSLGHLRRTLHSAGVGTPREIRALIGTGSAPRGSSVIPDRTRRSGLSRG